MAEEHYEIDFDDSAEAAAAGPQTVYGQSRRTSRLREALRWGRRHLGRVLLLGVAAYAGMFAFHQFKSLPDGVHVRSPPASIPADQVEFLHDLTFERNGSVVLEQEIFDRVFATIDSARRFVVVDMFLFNDFAGEAGAGYEPLSEQLTERLLARKGSEPGLFVLFITDPINRHYGGAPSRQLDALAAGGVEVVITDLGRLRDSNPVWSSFWRLCCGWLPNSEKGGWLTSPFDPNRKVTLRTYLALLNFKANHRKVLVADDGGDGVVGIVTSANPHDASSRHSNVAFEVRGAPALDLLSSELAVARWSGWEGSLPESPTRGATSPGSPPVPAVDGEENGAAPDRAAVRVLTEGAVREAFLSRLVTATPDDRLDMAMFYLSDRMVVDGVIALANRGARVRVLLDANRDAFGREKGGIPNRPVAHEMVEKSGGNIEVRWYRTHGEQFHTKMTVLHSWDRVAISLGSSNLTRRNIGDYNLEANLEVEVAPGSDLEAEVSRYFEDLWSNAGDAVYTDDYESFEDDSTLRYWLYRFQELTGLSTF